MEALVVRALSIEAVKLYLDNGEGLPLANEGRDDADGVREQWDTGTAQQPWGRR